MGDDGFMPTADPLVIEVALNGVTSKRVNPNVPVGVTEIVADARTCIDAGASIVHQHDDFSAFPQPGAAGMAALSAATYRPLIAEHPGLLCYPTADFLSGPDDVAHWGHHELLAADGLIRLALLDPGSVTFGGVGADGLPAGGVVYGYTYDEIAHVVERCGGLGLGPSIAVYEPGWLRVVLAYARAGRLPPGAFVKFYFGGPAMPFGLPATLWSLEVYLELMDGLDLPWAVAVLGGDVVASGLAEAAIGAGGHVRVGLEDFAGDGAPSNAELVQEVVALAARRGRPVATCAEAARVLRLP